MELGPILRAIRRNKARFGLIAVEVALTLAVVANCIALIIDARTQMARPSGFDDEDLLFVQTAPFDAAFRDDNYRMNALRSDLAMLRAMPGVEAVTNTFFVPWIGGGSSGEFRVAGTTGPLLRSQQYNTDEGLVETLGVRVVEGHVFTRDEVVRDTERLVALFNSNRQRGSDGVPLERFTQDVVVTRAWAEHLFGPRGPYVGKLFEDSDRDHYRVIGVIDPFYNPYGWPIHEYALFYANTASQYDSGTQQLVRVEDGRASAMAKTIEEALTRANPMRTVTIMSISEVRSRYFGNQRMVVVLMGLVAVLLVVVTGLGIVGVTSFLVSERTRQIGTRRALGARMVDILRYFLVENWLVTTAGIALGVALAIGLNMALVSAVASAKLEPLTVVIGAVMLWLIGLGSALVPALRAARTSPAVATRSV